MGEHQWLEYKREQLWRILGESNPYAQIRIIHQWMKERCGEICRTFVVIPVMVIIYPDLPWNYNYLSENPLLTWEVFIQLQSKPWNYYKISQHRMVTWELVQQHNTIPWDYNGLSLNPNVTWHIVTRNPYKPWCFALLSRNPNIYFTILQRYPERPWCYANASHNPSITWEDVLCKFAKSWDFHALSKNRTLTPNIVRQHPNRNWDAKAIYAHPNFSWMDIKLLYGHSFNDHSELCRLYHYEKTNPNGHTIYGGNPANTFEQLYYLRAEYYPHLLRFYRIWEDIINNPMTSERDLFYIRYYQKQMKHVFEELVESYFHPDRYTIIISHGHFDFISR